MEAYEEIYNRMKGKYCEQTDCEIDEASDIAIRMRVLAGEIYNMQTSLDWLKRQLFSATADGDYLEYHAQTRGLERKPAQKAQGELTFYVNEPKSFDIHIPKGSVVATSDLSPIRFVTTEDGLLPAGGDLISLDAEAELAGGASNVAVGMACVPVSVPTEIDRADNREPFRFGTDTETDDELRDRIKLSYDTPSNGTNAAYYQSLALSVEGIAKASVFGRVRGAGTVDVYVCANGRAASAAEVAQVQSLMDKSRELNVDVLVESADKLYADVYVRVEAKAGYSAEYVRKMCNTAIEACLAAVPIGGKIYLSQLGTYLMNTGCIENYSFSGGMTNTPLSRTQFAMPGTIEIQVS